MNKYICIISFIVLFSCNEKENKDETKDFKFNCEEYTKKYFNVPSLPKQKVEKFCQCVPDMIYKEFSPIELSKEETYNSPRFDEIIGLCSYDLVMYSLQYYSSEEDNKK